MGRCVPGAGRPLEPAANRGSRQITAPASWEQNSAYVPLRPFLLLRRDDHDRRFYHRLCRRGPDHQPPQADAHREEAACNLSRGTSPNNDRADSGLILVLIFFRPEPRSRGDIKAFLALRAATRIHPHPLQAAVPTAP